MRIIEIAGTMYGVGEGTVPTGVLAIAGLTGPQLVELYNAATQGANGTAATVKRFSNRDTGIRRVEERLESYVEANPDAEVKEPTIIVEKPVVAEPVTEEVEDGDEKSIPKRVAWFRRPPPGTPVKTWRKGTKRDVLMPMLRRKEGATFEAVWEALNEFNAEKGKGPFTRKQVYELIRVATHYTGHGIWKHDPDGPIFAYTPEEGKPEAPSA